MAYEDSSSTPFTMPVAPAYSGGGFGNGFGGDWAWIILLLVLCGGWGNGFGGGFGGNELYPWMSNANNINNGFRDQMLNTGISSIGDKICTGFGDVQTALCGGFAGVTAAVNGAQNAVAQQLYANQISDLERSYAAQTASTAGMTAIQTQIANEACATRASNTQNTQSILDKLCSLELDGYRRENDQLRTQLNMANLAASQTAQTAELRQSGAAQLNQLVSELRSCPLPAQPVYGNTPIFQCNGNSGCGCGSF